MPIYSCYEKGDAKGARGGVHARHRLTVEVSDKDWNDFRGQVTETIAFLTTWELELVALIAAHQVEHAYLDFPLYSRLDSNIINQNDHLPKELIALAGRIGLGIEMSIYERRAFDELDDPPDLD